MAGTPWEQDGGRSPEKASGGIHPIVWQGRYGLLR